MRNTTCHQKDKPEVILTDHRGTPIEKGKKVAYNKSGEVVLGTIVSWKSDWDSTRLGVEDAKWWSSKFLLIIDGEDGEQSKIKNPNSFVII